jgi:hypothetical protein
MVAIFAGFTRPVTAPQILWVKGVTSVVLGLRIRLVGEATQRTAGLDFLECRKRRPAKKAAQRRASGKTTESGRGPK